MHLMTRQMQGHSICMATGGQKKLWIKKEEEFYVHAYFIIGPKHTSTSYCEADLRIVFVFAKFWFSHEAAHLNCQSKRYYVNVSTKLNSRG